MPKVDCSERESIELVQHHIGHGVALQLDHDAHAFARRLVADVGDAFDLLLAHQLGDALDHHRLVHLIGNLGDDERLALACGISSVCTRARMTMEPRPV